MNEKSRNLVAGFLHENMWTDNKPILSTKYAPYCVDKHRMLKLFCGKRSKLDFKGAKTANECYVYTYDGRNVIYIGKLTCRGSFCVMYADNKFYSVRFRNIESYRVINNKFKVDMDSKLPSKAADILFKENKF